MRTNAAADPALCFEDLARGKGGAEGWGGEGWEGSGGEGWEGRCPRQISRGVFANNEFWWGGGAVAPANPATSVWIIFIRR